MAGNNNQLLLSGLLVLSFAFNISSSEADTCVMTVFVKTGDVGGAGTDATMTFTVANASGNYVRINGLKNWGGIMGAGHDYYERGQLDIFSGQIPCLEGTPCHMTITSDDTGEYPGWYLDYISVTVTGIDQGCAKQNFPVDQWLATDEYPFVLTAERNLCGTKDYDKVGKSMKKKSSSNLEGQVVSDV